jgi:VWFA-related protein
MMRGRAESYISDYLRTMPTGTQVAIFGYRADLGLRLIQGFTDDGSRAATSIDNIALPVCKAPWADPIAAADQMAAYVAGIHGRKNLIWIGSPPPIVHDGGLSWAIGAPPDMTIVHRLMNLYDLFTKEQIAIYPLDPKGVHKLGPTAPKMDPSAPPASAGPPTGPSRGSPFAEALKFLAQAEAPLLEEAIADETGGATSNSNDFQATIAKIVDDTEHSYVLSYVPPRPDVDGHFHPIQIKVDRPGVHLSYRTGYNDERPFSLDPVLKQQMIQGPMRLGALPSTQLLFNLQVEPAPPGPAPSSQPASSPIPNTSLPHTKGTPYDALFLFDPKQVALTLNPDGTRTASIEVDLGAYDSFGQLVSARSQAFKLTVTPAQYSGFLRGPLQFPLAIDLPHGQLNLRAGLFDTVANKSGTLEIPLTVPKK